MVKKIRTLREKNGKIMKKKLEELTEKELMIEQIRISSNMNKNIRTITTLMILIVIFSIIGTIMTLI